MLSYSTLLKGLDKLFGDVASPKFERGEKNDHLVRACKATRAATDEDVFVVVVVIIDRG